LIKESLLKRSVDRSGIRADERAFLRGIKLLGLGEPREMPVQFIHNGAKGFVDVDGTRRRFAVDREKADIEAYFYVGPAEDAPADVIEELDEHLQEHLVDDTDDPDPSDALHEGSDEEVEKALEESANTGGGR